MRFLKLPSLYAGRGLRAYAALGLGLSLAACATPTATPGATPTPLIVSVAVRELTAPLLEDLAAAYLTATVQTEPVSEVVLTAESVPPDFFATPIGYVEFVVVVHPANPLTSLTLTQTRAIFTGQMADWAQVSPGLSGWIQVVSRETESDSVPALGQILGEPTFPTRTALVAPAWAAMREAVSGDANRLGYLPRAELDSSVKALSIAGGLRALIVAMSANEPTGPTRDFLVWAQSAAGQAVVAQKYIVLTTDHE